MCVVRGWHNHLLCIVRRCVCVCVCVALGRAALTRCCLKVKLTYVDVLGYHAMFVCIQRCVYCLYIIVAFPQGAVCLA